MNQMHLFLRQIQEMVWGIPLLVLLLGTGAYLTFILRGVQIRYMGFAIKQVFKKNRQNRRAISAILKPS